MNGRVPSGVSARLRPFGTTIFTTMTRLAQQHGAVNLSQGFPDFDGPLFIAEAAVEAVRGAGGRHNQYAPMAGVAELRRAIAERFCRDTGLACDAETQVVVTSGCTEAIAAALIGLCDPGDEVVLFEPFYDSYRAAVAMAGATARYVALRPRFEERGGRRVIAEFSFDEAELRGAFGPRTRAVLVNTPHNPTGKVFSRAELGVIARLCVEHNALAVADEVYERLVFEAGEGGAAQPHVSIASLPGMAERTLTLSSLGKTFSFTGWKIGWAVGPADLVAAVRSAHQFLTFAVATPLQHAAAVALSREAEAVGELLPLLRGNRDLLAGALGELGFCVYVPAGTYFVCADHAEVSKRLGVEDDKALCMALIERCGVAAIPPSVFYERTELGKSLVRFAFCKRRDTVEEGVRRLRRGLG